MLLARQILLHDDRERFARILENHDSFYIGSDVFFTFLVDNNLFRQRLQLCRGSQISDEEFHEIEHRFLAGKFPPEIMDQFQNMLEYFGQSPIIVRSSSLLEDSFGNAFAGKYRSEFCVNQGSPEERMESFLRAVRLVYASALNPDALLYRKKRGLDQCDEQMALLVQRVSGMHYGSYFFPTLGGVAFSKNNYAWSNRIDPQQGVIRLVFGLGTRAVDRIGGDYPRLISISHPELRPEVGDKVIKYSQREIDVLDLEKNDLVTLPLEQVIGDLNYPNLHLFVSELREGFLTDPLVPLLSEECERHVLTFNNLIHQTDFVQIMGEMMNRVESGYGHPVDTEFTAFVNDQGEIRINLLQCRPLGFQGTEDKSITLPENVPSEKVLFRSTRIVTGGIVSDIRYIILIDPRSYSELSDTSLKKSLGRVVGRINSHPRILEGRSIMMGPGRWGSSNINLGVNVNYSDISNTSVLVEIAREEAGQVPEVSYGTHFFLDLVEAQIIYMPVYPTDERVEFNHHFLYQSPNILSEILPDAVNLQDLIRVIDIYAVTNGEYLQVVADPQEQKAICYIEKSDISGSAGA
jgi:pyruvate,water dikinase